MSWRTIKKYLDAPAQKPAPRQRESQLDPFKATIAEWVEKRNEARFLLLLFLLTAREAQPCSKPHWRAEPATRDLRVRVCRRRNRRFPRRQNRRKCCSFIPYPGANTLGRA
jgi:hypothetical protein